jgi:hypothetical protein
MDRTWVDRTWGLDRTWGQSTSWNGMEPTGTDHFIKLLRDLSLRQKASLVAEEMSDRDFVGIQDFGPCETSHAVGCKERNGAHDATSALLQRYNHQSLRSGAFSFTLCPSRCCPARSCHSICSSFIDVPLRGDTMGTTKRVAFDSTN